MFVLAVDPGGTTGLAFVNTGLSPKVYRTATASTPGELYDIIVPELDIVICENFRAQRIDHYGLYTTKLVGGVQAVCHKLGIKFVLHQPVDRRPFQDRALKLITWRHVIHEVDAMAHLLRWEHDNERSKNK